MIFGMMVFGLCSVTVETGSLKGFLYAGEPNTAYDKWLSHVSEGIALANYNLYAPYDRQLNGFGDYHVATTTELTNWGLVIDAFLSGDMDATELQIAAGGFPYQVVQFNDTDTGRMYYMLRENVSQLYYDDNATTDTYDDETGAFAWGWGLYIYSPSGTRPVIISAPHPCDDFATIPFSLEAFQLWNAKFMMCAGAGREVKWTNVNPYTNTKSLSDPTRVAGHPFNVAYQRFANLIRTQYSLREFSPQIHSYDWNRHVGMANLQISAGYQKYCPNLPIRDLSNLKHDLINKGDHLMIPANTFGIHRDVFLNDYYSVFYSTHDFTYTDGVHTYPVNDQITLPAYSQNQQMAYTLSGWNDYDSYDPFFHVEMDELPNCYEETEVNYKWFYGFDAATQKWDYSRTFEHFFAYYRRWIVDLNSLFDEMFQMNDQASPTDPTNLYKMNESLNSVTLGWTKSSAYDFDTYEVLYATQPIGLANYQIFSRTNAALLASQASESVTVTGLTNSNTYYFRIRAKDKNGNYSNMSNEIVCTPGPANVTSFSGFGMNNTVRLYWTVSGQTNNLGFKLYRRDPSSNYQLVDSYLTNPALSNSTAGSFEYWDNNVTNGTMYTYKLSSTNTGGVEYYYYNTALASPRPIHAIYIRNASGTLADSIFFGANPYASDGQDTYFDVNKSGPTSNYVWNAFWEQYWGNNGTLLTREIKGEYDLDNELKSWVMQVRSDQLSQPLYISTSNTFGRYEKLYLQDSGNGSWNNLSQGQYQFSVTNSNARNMTLYWGNLSPKITIGSQANRVYQGGTSAQFLWSYTYSFLIDHADLWIKSGADSLMISGNLPTTTTSYTYYVPQQADWQNCKLVMYLTAVDGAITRYEGPFTFAMVPAMSFASFEPGWGFHANPWNTSSLTVETVFGAGAVGYSLAGDEQWTPQTDFAYGTGYFVNTPDFNFYSSLSPVVRDEVNFPLVTGWNLIPNPHLCSYGIEDIRFMIGTTVYRMAEMISFGLVSPGLYVYRGGQYVLADTLQPYEALMIKYYGDAALGTVIDFLPFFSAPVITPPANDWQLVLKADRGDADQEQILIGTNRNATDDYDFYYDVPKAISGPFAHLNMYIDRSAETDTLFNEEKLISEIRSGFTGDEEQAMTWNFRLESESTEPVHFTFVPNSIPENWTVSVYVNGSGHHLYDGTDFTLIPDENGDISGTIIVRNYYVGNSDPIQPVITGLKSYPNPFNPSTTISFNVTRQERVRAEIFNLRGQRVLSLYNDLMDKGSKELVWNGKDEHGRSVSSGVYFVKVSQGKQNTILKMMLVK